MPRFVCLLLLLMLLPYLGQAALLGAGPPSALNSNASSAGENIDQDVATDGSVWVAVWNEGGYGDRDILFARSVDAGQTWSTAATLNATIASNTTDDLIPRIATDGSGNWIVVWYSRDTLGGTVGTDHDILYSVSNDDGNTWSASAALNSRATTDAPLQADTTPSIASNGNGTWITIWRSPHPLGGSAGTDIDIHVAISTDVGASWSPQAALDPNASTDSGFDTAPEIVSDGTDWMAVWYSNDDAGGTIGTDYDVLVSASVDDGASWSASIPVNTTAATDTGADLHPDVAVDSSGNWLTIWRSTEDIGGAVGTEPDLFVARSADVGASWTDPQLVNTSGTTDSGDDIEPRLATDGLGTWVALWHSDDDMGGTGFDFDMFIAVSTDLGSTWCAPTQPGAGNPDLDYRPDIVTDRLGNWVITWTSRDDLDGTIGNEDDILVSRLFELPTTHLPAMDPAGTAILIAMVAGVGAALARRH